MKTIFVLLSILVLVSLPSSRRCNPNKALSPVELYKLHKNLKPYIDTGRQLMPGLQSGNIDIEKVASKLF